MIRRLAAPSRRRARAGFVAALACVVAIDASAAGPAGAPRRTADDTTSVNARANDTRPSGDSSDRARPARAKRSTKTSPRALAIGGAVFPGFIAHGTGHFIYGRQKVARQLLMLEGAGLGLTLLGLGGLAVTGASSRTVAPFAISTIGGLGLFSTTFLADLYGVAMPDEARGRPLRRMPDVVTYAGVFYAYNPVFSYGTFARTGLDIRRGAWRLSPELSASPAGRNTIGRVEGAYRLTGPRAGADETPSRDGSFVDLRAAYTHHAFGLEAVDLSTGEAQVRGRLDLERIGDSLSGSFAELGTGLALQSARVRRLTSDASTLLLGRFGFGIYLGRRDRSRGEIQIYYDHRHDGLAGGLKMPGVGSGVGGFVGANASAFVRSGWGVLVDAQAGSALVAGISLAYRHGVR